ncbi:glycosyltransferase family 4 protein [Calothrix sp. NIES-2098]|uniref:glycosyltransferase family 4 protein n=1 Tax=Calothrix sp. NIES-2098 TaxID=1954171 RepID=UPI000B6076A0|nr:group 1 glycosyl transferase [Calothrix sp. NIES-2098]
MVKIAVIFTNYGPYHISRVSALHKKCSEIGWEVIGIELARHETTYTWKVNVQELPFKLISIIEESPLEQVKFHHFIAKLYSILAEVKVDVFAIAGYFNFGMLATLLWSMWHRKPAILLSETTENDSHRSWWREIVKSWIVRKYKSALVGGQPQKRYLLKLGLLNESIFLGYDVVGNETFHTEKIKSLQNPLKHPYFLAINRFIPKKNLEFLISSYAKYRQIKGDGAWNLVLCGNGRLRSKIEHQVAELDLENTVYLPGFLQQNELLPYFAHANCFVHSSTHEQWGLVVNEAMAAGLPVLVSNRCGCFEDLIIDGVNGFGFDPENSQQLTDLMIKISSKEIDIKTMGQAALEHIQKFSPDYFAQGLIQAVEYAVASK